MGDMLAVWCRAPGRRAQASTLAGQIGAPLLFEPDDHYRYLVCYEAQTVSLCGTGRQAPRPILVDFLNGKTGYRLVNDTSRRQMLARAVGIKAGMRPRVMDATAGLGADGMLLAHLGCTVHLLERSAVIAELLRDGLRRAAASERLAETTQRVTLQNRDAMEYLTCTPDAMAPDVIYLDPMYPHAKKGVLRGKEMRALRALVGDDADSDRLFQTALRHSRTRVVVKRPRKAAAMTGPSPSFQVRGNTTRFDVYLLPESRFDRTGRP